MKHWLRLRLTWTSNNENSWDSDWRPKATCRVIWARVGNYRHNKRGKLSVFNKQEYDFLYRSIINQFFSPFGHAKQPWKIYGCSSSSSGWPNKFWTVVWNDLNGLKLPQWLSMTSKASNDLNGLQWPQWSSMTSMASNDLNGLKLPQMTSMASNSLKNAPKCL